jgi:RNA polymerase sigma-70 factor (ECF subfamily)
VALTANGDKTAFAVLTRRYLSKMVVLARRITLDVQDANEVVQEGFMRVWIHAGKWDPCGTASFETWLRRVITNLAISRWRRHREQVSLDIAAEIPDTNADAFDQVSSDDQKKLVRIAIEKLPPKQRAAVAAYYFDESSYIEAAEQLNLSLKAFNSLLVRARQNLKKHFLTMGIKHWAGGL